LGDEFIAGGFEPGLLGRWVLGAALFHSLFSVLSERLELASGFFLSTSEGLG
jgi:hypothetical protein